MPQEPRGAQEATRFHSNWLLTYNLKRALVLGKVSKIRGRTGLAGGGVRAAGTASIEGCCFTSFREGVALSSTARQVAVGVEDTGARVVFFRAGASEETFAMHRQAVRQKLSSVADAIGIAL